MMRCRLCFEGDQKKAFVVVFQSMAAFFQSVKRVRKFKLQNYFQHLAVALKMYNFIHRKIEKVRGCNLFSECLI